MIDNYCERLGPGLFGEPVNSLSNIAFWLAAWLAWRYIRQHGRAALSTNTLLLLLLAIGFGSSAYHSWPSEWTLWLDVIPILLFQLAFLGVYQHSQISPSRLLLFASYGLFVLLTALMAQSPVSLNGSIAYATPLLMLIMLASLGALRGVIEFWRMTTAIGLFMVSLLFRSLDQSLCASFGIGTHFIWHLLNSVVLYLLLTHLSTNLNRIRA